MAEQCSKQASVLSDSNPKYLYFNKLNLAYKSTVHCDNRRLSSSLTTPEVLRIITDIHNDTSRSVKITSLKSETELINDLILNRLKEAGEIVIKTMSDYWIVGKLSNLREFFVVIQQKNASIIEIDGNYFKIFNKSNFIFTF